MKPTVAQNDFSRWKMPGNHIPLGYTGSRMARVETGPSGESGSFWKRMQRSAVGGNTTDEMCWLRESPGRSLWLFPFQSKHLHFLFISHHLIMATPSKKRLHAVEELLFSSRALCYRRCENLGVRCSQCSLQRWQNVSLLTDGKSLGNLSGIQFCKVPTFRKKLRLWDERGMVSVSFRGYWSISALIPILVEDSILHI